jgi:hypothetical protein
MVKYLEQKIVEVRQTETPRWGMTSEGYTCRGGAPTSRLIRLEGEKRMRRLYAGFRAIYGSVDLRTLCC